MAASPVTVGEGVILREDVTDEECRRLQEGLGPWNEHMRRKLTTVCRVLEVDEDRVKIQTEDEECFVNVKLIKVAGLTLFRENEEAFVLGDEMKMKELQVDHGGWNDIMKILLGKTVTIVRVVSANIRKVKYLEMEFNVNVACLTTTKPSGREANAEASVAQAFMELQTSLRYSFEAMGLLFPLGTFGFEHLDDPHLSSFPNSNHLFTGFIDPVDWSSRKLIETIRSGDKENLSQLIKSEIIDKPCSSTGLTPLMIALETNQEDIFDLLIEKGANINGKDKKGNNLLHFVITKKMEDATVDKLIKGGVEINGQNNDGKSVLMTCVENDNSTVFSKLMDDDLIDVSLQDKDGDTAAHYAIREGRVEMIKRLIEGGCCMKTENNDKFSPFHLSVLANQYEIVELMLEKEGSALVNLQKSNDKYSGLHLTALHGYCDVMKLLIRHGADTTLRNNDGETALHIAVLKDVDCVKLLCREMEDINVEDHRGNSPLHRLVHRIPEKELENGLKIAQCLIEFHVDMNMVNKRGMTAIGICENKEMKEMLIDSMGTKDSEKENKIEEQPLQDVSDLKVLEEQIIKFEDERLCKICIDRPKDTIFDCGHICCGPCSSRLTSCPVCREMISSRIKLFSTVL